MNGRRVLTPDEALLPVDKVSRAINHLSKRVDSLERGFHDLVQNLNQHLDRLHKGLIQEHHHGQVLVRTLLRKKVDGVLLFEIGEFNETNDIIRQEMEEVIKESAKNAAPDPPQSEPEPGPDAEGSSAPDQGPDGTDAPIDFTRIVGEGGRKPQ